MSNYLQGLTCLENCLCHDGARYDQIECCCPYWCGNSEHQICPKCGYDGLGEHDNRKGFGKHINQLNPENQYDIICGNCSEVFCKK